MLGLHANFCEAMLASLPNFYEAMLVFHLKALILHIPSGVLRLSWTLLHGVFCCYQCKKKWARACQASWPSILLGMLRK